MEFPQELALQGRLLSSVLGFLPPPSLCISVLVCRIWHAAATDDTWRRTAEQAWPAKSVRLVSRDQLAVEAGIALQYSTFRQLVLGQNKYNVGLSRRRGLPALLNRWRHNTATRCYLNHILAVHYCPIDEGGALRVYYEARGENDLRNPLTSAVSLRLETAQDRVSGPSGKVNHAIIGSALPDVERSRFFVEKRGHYKGVLVYAFGPLEQQCGARSNVALDFTFACDPGDGINMDYDHVTLIAASHAPSSASTGTSNAEHAQSWLAQLGKGVQTLLNLPPLRSTQAGSASASAGEVRCASLLARFGETAEVAVLADDYDEYSHEADEASQRRFAAAAIPATKLNSAWWKPTEYIGAVLDGTAT